MFARDLGFWTELVLKQVPGFWTEIVLKEVPDFNRNILDALMARITITITYVLLSCWILDITTGICFYNSLKRESGGSMYYLVYAA